MPFRDFAKRTKSRVRARARLRKRGFFATDKRKSVSRRVAVSRTRTRRNCGTVTHSDPLCSSPSCFPPRCDYKKPRIPHTHTHTHIPYRMRASLSLFLSLTRSSELISSNRPSVSSCSHRIPARDKRAGGGSVSTGKHRLNRYFCPRSIGARARAGDSSPVSNASLVIGIIPRCGLRPAKSERFAP